MLKSKMPAIATHQNYRNGLAVVNHATPVSLGKAPLKSAALSEQVILLNSQGLSNYLMDAIAECQSDWITLLHQDWEIELYEPILTEVDDQNSSLKHSCFKIADFIALLPHEAYRPVSLKSTTYWTHTTCLQIVGLGRVRFVAVFNQGQPHGKCAAFVTNRLDWSPQKIVSQWIQQHPLPDLKESSIAHSAEQNTLQVVFS